MKPFRFFHSILKIFVSLFGSDLVDFNTGEKVARAFLFCWRGHIYVIGLEGKNQVIPQFLPQKRMSLWKRKMGFTSHPPPDFPSDPPPGSSP